MKSRLVRKVLRTEALKGVVTWEQVCHEPYTHAHVMRTAKQELEDVRLVRGILAPMIVCRIIPGLLSLRVFLCSMWAELIPDITSRFYLRDMILSSYTMGMGP